MTVYSTDNPFKETDT